MNAKQELQDLLAKVDRHFVVDPTQYQENEAILGTIAGQPARLSMTTKISGWQVSKAQVIFQVIINTHAVMTWGCVSEGDTSHLVHWFLLKRDNAKQEYYDMQNSMRDVWDALK